jgi:hypothetical protein
MFLTELQSKNSIKTLLFLIGGFLTSFCFVSADVSQTVNSSQTLNINGYTCTNQNCVPYQGLGGNMQGTLTSIKLNFNRSGGNTSYYGLVLREYNNLTDYNSGANDVYYSPSSKTITGSPSDEYVQFNFTNRVLNVSKYYRIQFDFNLGSSAYVYAKGSSSNVFSGGSCSSTPNGFCGSVQDIYFVLSGVSSGPTNAVCGSDNGQTLSTAPTNFCATGTLITPSYVQTATGWSWSCSGVNGGTQANCSARLGQNPNNAVCGSDNGQTLSTAPTNFCATGTLITPSYVQTATGWSWDCGGLNGGALAHCFATMQQSLIVNYPTLPNQDDCSSYSVPDSWFCQISNMLKSAILPSSSKLNELNQAINFIGAKAPFNYINSANLKLQELKTNISTSSTLSFTLLGNTGNINLNAWGNSLIGIRRVLAVLFAIGFLFWSINYIKRIFV